MQQSQPDIVHAVAGLGLRVTRARARAAISEARDLYGARLALVSSFGADSIALLHLTASVDPTIPVRFIDTGRHFPETLAYVEDVRAQLGLTDLRHVRPPRAEVERLDPRQERAAYDPDGCCEIRKVEPLRRAKAGLDSWISGRKAFQSVWNLVTNKVHPSPNDDEADRKQGLLMSVLFAAASAAFSTVPAPTTACSTLAISAITSSAAGVRKVTSSAYSAQGASPRRRKTPLFRYSLLGPAGNMV